ncbi:hypothetical protein AMTR_s00077p00066660 [Amborella trichopoda]|uniref:Uncharacterized protein n=1 Tax=Amborella trichopoda TaxID=13333 RepID=W1P956_AMBTC|nr:hypothetical protein AMTR_s00077p00066660 [Amborella trichopoda]
MALNYNGSASISIIPVPPPHEEMPYVSKAKEVLLKTKVFCLRFDQLIKDILQVWSDYERFKVHLDLVCPTLEVVNSRHTKIEDTMQRIGCDFKVVEDGLEELRSLVYRY